MLLKVENATALWEKFNTNTTAYLQRNNPMGKTVGLKMLKGITIELLRKEGEKKRGGYILKLEGRFV